MTRRRPGDPPSGGNGREPVGGQRPESAGWSVFSYMIGGMVLYGAIGWLVGRWTHIPALFPIGMLTGLALALALIIFRFTRS